MLASVTASRMPRVVFATVGTTQFDALTSTLMSAGVLDTLADQGYERLVIQVGRGAAPMIPESPPLDIKWYAHDFLSPRWCNADSCF